jgi:hypothetical protein
MKRAKGDYKREARKAVGGKYREKARKMGESLATNDKRDLWSELSRLKSGQQPAPDRVDDAQGEKEVCDLFSRKYEELYNSVPYNPVAMRELMTAIDDLIATRCDNGLCYSAHLFKVEDVTEAIGKLKCGKADSLPLFSSDQIVHGGTHLTVHLTLLFNCMMRHIFVPKKLLVATLVPIPKNCRKSMYDSSNYRSIALSSIIGKVLDRMILTLHADVLSTSHL